MTRGPKTQLDSFDDIADLIDLMDHKVATGGYANAFELISDDLEEQAIGQFKEGVAADGRPWAPLSTVTIARKGHARILIEEGDLMNSLTGHSAASIREISQTDLVFGTRDPKAAFHQDGTRRMPARPPVGISEETMDKAAEHVADRAVELAMEALK